MRARIRRLEREINKLLAETRGCKQRDERMNEYFEAAGVGLRYENGDLVNHPELGHPAPNRDITDYE